MKSLTVEQAQAAHEACMAKREKLGYVRISFEACTNPACVASRKAAA